LKNLQLAEYYWATKPLHGQQGVMEKIATKSSTEKKLIAKCEKAVCHFYEEYHISTLLNLYRLEYDATNLLLG
jgi:hypothetical protein